jgi:hypothetical protein
MLFFSSASSCAHKAEAAEAACLLLHFFPRFGLARQRDSKVLPPEKMFKKCRHSDSSM